MESKLKEDVDGVHHALAFAQTPELIAEIKRRALGCLIMSVRPEEETGDVWLCGIKGSPMLIGAMFAALQMQTQAFLEDDSTNGISMC